MDIIPSFRFSQVLVVKTEGKRPKCRWKNSIKMDLRETGLDVVDWLHLIQDRDRCRAVMNTVR
jgi:hypothetical protein